jgi:hypothetical protein
VPVAVFQLVCDKVLAARGGLHGEGRLLCVLEAPYKLHGVHARKEGVLARGLDVAAPPGIADALGKGLVRGEGARLRARCIVCARPRTC